MIQSVEIVHVHAPDVETAGVLLIYHTPQSLCGTITLCFLEVLQDKYEELLLLCVLTNLAMVRTGKYKETSHFIIKHGSIGTRFLLSTRLYYVLLP